MIPRSPFRAAARVAFLLALSGALPALAQPRDDSATTHVEAFMRMRQASAARARGDLEEAARLLREALTMDAPPEALRELALVYETQHRWREAAGLWTRFSTLALRNEDRSMAIARREALRRMLTALHVRVTPPIAARAARVWFDHEPPRWYQAGGIDFVAEGGSHRVRVEVEGYQPWEMMVPTGFGEAVSVVAVMVRRAGTDAGTP